MANRHEPEVINGATPLECELAGVHPRLYLTAERIEELRARVRTEPWRSFLGRVQALADAAVRNGCPREAESAGKDLRYSVGCVMPNLAMAWLMTGERRYLDATVDYLLTAGEYNSWGSSLTFGHWAHGSAVAYDWLYHELDESTRRRVADSIEKHTRAAFADWSSYSSFMSFCYTCNHSSVILTGFTAAGGALYGERENVAPWLRMTMEKARLMTSALGPDGVSPEGIAYGQYYVDFLLKSLHLIADLLGVDFLRRTEWFRQYPTALLYHMLPRESWSGNSLFVMFGDAFGSHWIGPDWHLRRCAWAFRDGRAQWLADATHAAGVTHDSSCFLNLLWHDPAVEPVPPTDLPTVKHFTDQDSVIMRSGWDGEEEVCAFRCTPPGGHKAITQYNHNVTGGHMHPDAGHFLIFSHGDWLIADDGYAKKQTAYQNTALVNGVGQAGEGGPWCEDLEFRKGKAAPHIVRAATSEWFDHAIADVAPAYESAARLKKFVRQVLYVKPSCWIVIDDLEAAAPSTFELFFHAPSAFTEAGDRRYARSGRTGALLVESLLPKDSVCRAEGQPILATDTGHGDRTMDVLIISNPRKRKAVRFVTFLHAHPAGAGPSASARIVGGKTVEVRTDRQTLRFALEPGAGRAALPAARRTQKPRRRRKR